MLNKLVLILMAALLLTAMLPGCSFSPQTSDSTDLEAGKGLDAEQKEKETGKEPVEQQEPENAAVDKTLDLSDLKNGDKIVDGFIIKDIVYDNYSASFTMAGEAVLSGEIHYSEYLESLMFSFSNDIFPTIVMFDDFHYTPGWLILSNEDALINAMSLSDQDLKEMIEKGTTISVKIQVKDLEFTGQRESEYGTSAELVQVIDS